MSKKTIELILNSGNDYLIALKRNQGNLFKQVEQHLQQSQPIDTYSSEEKNRGRLENRHVAIYNAPQQLAPPWRSIRRIVYVHRFGNRPDKGEYNEEHYYILSQAHDHAAFIAEKIRNHWWIENKLHYVKDVHFNEDKSGIRDGQAAANLSLIQDMAITLFRAKGFSSIKKATIYFANKIKELWAFINACHISEM